MNKQEKQETIKIKADQVYARLEELGYDKKQIMGVFLYGAQNYNLDTENSDFDFKVIIIPTLKDLLRGNKISKSYKLDEHNENNEDQIEVKDILTMLEMWKKGNPAYLEILATQYAYFTSNEMEEFFVNKLRRNAQELNLRGTVSAILGMAYEKFAALDKEYPSKVDVIKEHGFDPKQLHHIVRLSYLMDHIYKAEKEWEEYVWGEHTPMDWNINDVIWHEEGARRDRLIEFKLNTDKYDKLGAQKIALMFIDKMKEKKAYILREDGALITNDTQKNGFDNETFYHLQEDVYNLIEKLIKEN